MPSLFVMDSSAIWVKPEEVLDIELDIVHNCININDKSWFFNRRWEVALIAKLLSANERGHKCNLAVLQEEVAIKGQASPLNRTQISRLLSSVADFLAVLPGLQLQHRPRQASTGPWALQVTRQLRWRVLSAAQTAGQAEPSSPNVWSHPRLVCKDAPPCPDALLQLLRQVITAEAFAKYGQHASAVEVLTSWDWQPLSAEAQGLFRLRQADWLRRAGQFEEAKALAQALCNAPTQDSDPTLTVQARHLLRRIAYDENPPQAWRELLDDPQTPAIRSAVCWQTQSEWHNLQALALRRAAQDAQKSQDRATHHVQVLLHTEAALYGAVRQQNWDRLHAYIDNLAFHLQKMQPLGLSTLRQVHDWYGLSLACADKLDSGADDIWDMVYFGEFWLDHALALTGLDTHWMGMQGPLPHHPMQQSYWTHLCRLSTDQGTPRLQATAIILYLRWARAQAMDELASTQQKQLIQLLQDHPGMAESLRRDGYAEWLSGLTA